MKILGIKNRNFGIHFTSLYAKLAPLVREKAVKFHVEFYSFLYIIIVEAGKWKGEFIWLIFYQYQI